MVFPNYGYRVAWSDEDHAYVATCAELDGLSGLGDSAEEALGELRVAIELTVEELAETGARIPDPIQACTHSGQFRLRLPKSVHARLTERAEAEGVSLNALVASYIAMGLGDAEASENAHRAVVEAVGQLYSTFTLQAHARSEHARAGSRSRVVNNDDSSPSLTSAGGADLWQN